MKRSETLIQAIAVRGYKAIEAEQRMEIRPLTILAGANSSGKSSMMQPLLLLKQTLENAFDPGVFSLNGPNVRFTSAEQLLSNIPGKPKGSTFSVRFEKEYGVSIALMFKKADKGGFDIEAIRYTFKEGASEITLGMSHEQILKVLPEPMRTFHKQFAQQKENGEWQWVVDRERCFLTIVLRRKGTPTKRTIFGPMQFSPASMIVPEIESIIHVPGLRGNPERSYSKTTSVGPNFPGTFENYVASVISQWQSSGEKVKVEELGSLMEKLGLTWKVDAKGVDDTQVELRVGRLPHSKRSGAYDMVNIADVGFGVSQVLPVLVALLVARPGQLVYLEQPEIHLHPLAQRQLAGVLASAAIRGVRIIVESHSSLLLRGIQTLVAKGELSPDLVKLHWFKRNPIDGVTALHIADLDANGAFGDWPEDFDEINLSADKDYLDAVEEKVASA